MTGARNHADRRRAEVTTLAQKVLVLRNSEMGKKNLLILVTELS